MEVTLIFNEFSMPLEKILLIVIIIAIGRVAALYSLEAICKTNWAQNHIIYQPHSKHMVDHKRENTIYFIGLAIDTIILFMAIKFSILTVSKNSFMGILVLILSFIFITEPIYYFYHRLLHTPYLYNRHHIYHHKNLVPRPTSAFYFTIIERISYTFLFSLPLFILSFFNLLSVQLMIIYMIVFDFINAWGHTNVKMFPAAYVKSWLHYFLYSANYHADHHKYFRTNYALFMPIWDKIFGTYKPPQI